MTGTAAARIDNAALFAVLASLADNKQAMGRRYAYWANGAPALEAAVAAAAMTQDEIGHARTLYPLLEDFAQAATDPRQVAPETRTLRYHVAFLDREFASWSDFVATNFLLDGALTTFFEAAQQSAYEPLRQRARKIVQEEQVHRAHAEGWVRRLAKAGGAVRQALIASLQRLWEETLCWFGPDDDPVMGRLYREGFIDAPPAELRRRYLQRVMPLLEGLAIEMPARFDPERKCWLPERALPWERWEAESRRLTPTGPQAEREERENRP
uniref:Phenylacetate-CoA oxygenase subunit PaaI n=1 Tax=Thermogemmatispora argillosa TaxID=2045280 RepID=A0A455T566_9CHLR|nr:phenylacetate-CoA oxygenase subunit PaaI [Thermogemmatispora argillosa]